MHQKNKRSRIGRLAIGALVGSVLSIGATTGAASAYEQASTSDSGIETVVKYDQWGGGGAHMSSGIRW